MANYTSEEVKAALMCVENAMRQAHDLIDRQEAEIAELKTENQILSQKRMSIFENCEAFERGRVKGVQESMAKFKAQALVTHKNHNGFCVYEVDDTFIDLLINALVGEGE